jgi:urease accessory protein
LDSARTAVRPLTPLDERTTTSIGRSARFELVFERRGGRTTLTHAYAEPPFRVGRAFTEGDGLHLILATVAPGIFSGDSLRQIIRVGPGARVRLTSQSAMQVHPSPGRPPATIDSTFTVGDEGELRCFWEPLIPFAGAEFAQRIAIHLSEHARLAWSDAAMTGRAAHGERWAFQDLSHELMLRRQESFEYAERYRIAPATDRPTRRWVAGEASHFGTTLVSGWPVASEFVTSLHESLGRIEGVRAAADRLADRILLVRFLGNAGAAFREARAFVAAQTGS